jgi:hypothetical protein
MKRTFLQLLNPITIIFIAVVIRLLPHIPNVTPIAAMALFGGVYVNKRFALFTPLVAMIVSDIFLGFSLITLFVYGGFLLTGLIGLWLRNHKAIKSVFVASLTSSVLFFLITNVGVWLVWNFYPKTFTGLLDCLVAGLPFFRNTVLGDLFYVTLFFGGYALVTRFVEKKRIAV